MMLWRMSHRGDPKAVALADDHYSRQKPGTPQFVQPGRCLVLFAQQGKRRAVWVTSWPFAEYVRHEWPGAWSCAMFRNEGIALSSDLILQAVAATRCVFGVPPDQGIITFVDPQKIRNGTASGRQVGRCFIKAGWSLIGAAKDGKPCFQQLPDRMPPPDTPIGFTPRFLFGGVAA
jgi:hypothetical protein